MEAKAGGSIPLSHPNAQNTKNRKLRRHINKMKKEIIVASTIVAVAILGYGYMNYSAKQQTLQLEEKTRADTTKGYAKCLTSQEKKYKGRWNSECTRIGESNNCLLPNNISNTLNQYLENDKATCYKLYPVK